MLICPAVHIPTRSLLRSSSTPEPSDPLYSIVHTKAVDQNWPVSQKTEKKVDSSSRGGRATKKPRQGRRSLSGFVTIVRSTVHRTQSHGPPANTNRVEQISSELTVRNSVRPPADKPAAPEFPSKENSREFWIAKYQDFENR